MKENYILLEGKDLDDLIKEGLNILGKDKEEVDIEVIEKGKKVLGLFSKNYKIKLTIKEKLSEEPQDSDAVALKDISDEAIKEIEEIMYDLKDSIGYFELKYKEDGVYLIVYNGDTIKVSYDDVINRIKRKEIHNCDYNKIREAVDKAEEIQVKIAPAQEEICIDSELIIDISSDKMEAYITLTSPDGGKEINFAEGLTLIKETIKIGLNIEEVEKVFKDKVYNQKIMIAHGMYPIDGVDGYVDYKFSMEKNIAPKILEDGSVDFRDLNLITNVRKGDILAELVPPKDGTDGVTVTGELIKHKKGKVDVFKYGKNISISEDNLKLISDIDGQVSLEKGKIVVLELYEIKNNVDNSTGNIDFNGSVKVNGSVLTGFEIRLDGNLEVNGVVEGANIKSGGSIIVKRGIQGYNNSEISAEGDIFAKYIENSKVYSENDVNAEAIMHSDITSKGAIVVGGKKGLIVGGACRATKEIRAKTIGSSMATSTVLEVGSDPNLRNNQELMKKEIKDVEKEIDKLEKTISLLTRLNKFNDLPEDKKETLTRALRTKLYLQEKIKNLREELKRIDKEIEYLAKGKIIVENVIYPGVKIVIGNTSMLLKEETKHCTIYRDEGEIKIGPYR
ncbi:protein of unknown function DUF342 [Gottschalkia purinilytica]|uniref:RNA-binding protein KhpB N-terminal domain-containing protein n=1 Tax=Gottschalkia purinilytica TaxID=1503 RepID=A0A0L0WBI3_GOTPU|nr:FapA family protein [Gottschalkia purinilytica]KNF08841.1 protein of unknown function DUF342 [Gottschalkia purinilytica]